MDLKIIINEIKSRIDFRDYIDMYITDVPANKRIICPLHNDGTPSMYVNKDFGHCFSCNDNADIVGFVAAYDGTDLKTAVYKVAEQVGLNIDHIRRENSSYSPHRVITGTTTKKEQDGTTVEIERFKVFSNLIDSKKLEKELKNKKLSKIIEVNVPELPGSSNPESSKLFEDVKYRSFQELQELKNTKDDMNSDFLETQEKSFEVLEMEL